MAFSDLVANLDNACIDAFGDSAVWFPQSGAYQTPPTQYPITGVFAPPGMYEEVMPGYGTVVVRFFVRVDPTNMPLKGDTIEINGIIYDINQVEADVYGGATLKLRRKA